MELPPESEEVAGFYAALLETDHAKDATFNKNFFDDFLKILKKYPPVRPSRHVLHPTRRSYVTTEERHQDLEARAVRLQTNV